MINSPSVKARAKVAAEAEELTKLLDKLQRDLAAEKQKLAELIENAPADSPPTPSG